MSLALDLPADDPSIAALGPDARARVAGEVCRVFRQRLDPERRTTIVHVNPVFDAPHLGPRPLDPSVPTIGLRDAEDLPTVLAFARFADGGLSITDLEDYLQARALAFVARHARDPAPEPSA